MSSKSYSVVKVLCKCPVSCKTFIGLGLNMSKSGMCLYTTDNLYEGEEISVQEKLSAKYQKATVTWVKNYHLGFSRVGLTFHE